MKEKFIASFDKIAEISLWLIIIAIPFSIKWTQVCIVIAFLAFAAKMALYRKWDILRTDLNMPIFIFLFVTFLAVLHSTMFRVSLRAFFLKTLQYIAIYFAMVGTIREKSQIKRFLVLLCLLGIFVGLDSLFQCFLGKDLLFRPRWVGGPRVTGPFGNPVALALWAVLQAPIWLSLACFFRNKTKDFSRIMITCCGVLLTTSIVLSYSRGAWAALAVAVIFMLGLRHRLAIAQETRSLIMQRNKIITRWCFGVVIIIIFPAAVFIAGDLIGLQFNLDWKLPTSATFRFQMWANTLVLIKHSPILGAGLNAYMAKYASIFSTQNLDSISAHNSYLEMVAETGIFGLLAFFLLVFKFFKNSIRGLKAISQEQNSEFCFWSLVGMLGGAVGFLIYNFVESALHNFILAMFFWLILGLTVSLRKKLIGRT